MRLLVLHVVMGGRDRENYRVAGGDFSFFNSKFSGSHMPSPEEPYVPDPCYRAKEATNKTLMQLQDHSGTFSLVIYDNLNQRISSIAVYRHTYSMWADPGPGAVWCKRIERKPFLHEAVHNTASIAAATLFPSAELHRLRTRTLSSPLTDTFLVWHVLRRHRVFILSYNGGKSI